MIREWKRYIGGGQKEDVHIEERSWTVVKESEGKRS